MTEARDGHIHSHAADLLPVCCSSLWVAWEWKWFKCRDQPNRINHLLWRHEKDVFLFTLFLKIAYFHGYVSWILSASFWGHNKTCILESVPVPVHPWLFGSWQLLNFTWKWGVSAFHSVEFYSVQLNNLSVVITAFSPWNWSVSNLTKTSSRFIKKNKQTL